MKQQIYRFLSTLIHIYCPLSYLCLTALTFQLLGICGQSSGCASQYNPISQEELSSQSGLGHADIRRQSVSTVNSMNIPCGYCWHTRLLFTLLNVQSNCISSTFLLSEQPKASFVREGKHTVLNWEVTPQHEQEEKNPTFSIREL